MTSSCNGPRRSSADADERGQTVRGAQERDADADGEHDLRAQQQVVVDGVRVGSGELGRPPAEAAQRAAAFPGRGSRRVVVAP